MAGEGELVPNVALQIVRGRSSRKSRPMVGSSLLVGSDLHCDIQLRSPEVAPRHCLISRRGGEVAVTRLSVEHPVFLNGKAITEENAMDGDALTIGPFAMKLLVGTRTTPPTVVTTDPPIKARPKFALLERGKRDLVPPLAPTPQMIDTPDDSPADFHAAEISPVELHNVSLPPEADLPTPALDFPPPPRLQQDQSAIERRLRAWQDRLEQQESELISRLADLDGEKAHFEQRQRILEARQAKVKAGLIRRRSTRKQQRSRFAALLGDWEEKNAAVGRRESKLEDNQRRWNEIALRLGQEQAEITERRIAADAEIVSISAKRDALAGERSLLDKEWQRLFAKQHEVSRQARETAERDAKLRAEERTLIAVRKQTAAEIETLVKDQADVQSREQREAAKAVRLRGRERELDRRSEDLVRGHDAIHRRATELETRESAMHAEAHGLKAAIDRERADVETQRKRLEDAFAQHELEKSEFTKLQRQWRDALVAHERDRNSLTQTASMLAARERELAVRTGVATDEVQRERRELAEEQSKLADRANEMNLRQSELERRSTAAGSMAAELARRQQQLLERERALAASAELDRRNLEARTAELVAREADFDRLAAAQRRQMERLRTAGARFGSRRRILHDRIADLETRSTAFKQRIADVVASRDDLRRELDDYTARAKIREREAADWLRSVRQESDHLAETQRRIDQHVRSSVRPSFERSELQRRLGDWSQRMVRLQTRLADGERVLQLDPLTSLAPTQEPTTSIPFPSLGAGTDDEMEQDAEPVTPLDVEPTPPLQSTKDSPVRSSTPDRWALQLVELGLADSTVVNYLTARGLKGGPPLETSLATEGVVTPFQLRCVREDRISELSIGPLKVLDVLHQGRLSTTYRVKSPSLEKSVALKLLSPSIGHSQDMRLALHAALHPIVSFRHPNVASFYAVFHQGERLGLMTDVVMGVPIGEAAVERSPFDVVHCFRQVVGALAAVQQAGFMHGRLRPSRIIVSHLGRVGMIGFGEPAWLANLHRCEIGPTLDFFLAPEQTAVSGRVDARADLFAAGRIFLEAILGRRPANDELLQLPAGYPPEFAELLRRASHVDVGQRCRSLAEITAWIDDMVWKHFGIRLGEAVGGTSAAHRAAA